MNQWFVIPQVATEVSCHKLAKSFGSCQLPGSCGHCWKSFQNLQIMKYHDIFLEYFGIFWISCFEVSYWPFWNIFRGFCWMFQFSRVPWPKTGVNCRSWWSLSSQTSQSHLGNYLVLVRKQTGFAFPAVVRGLFGLLPSFPGRALATSLFHGGSLWISCGIACSFSSWQFPKVSKRILYPATPMVIFFGNTFSAASFGVDPQLLHFGAHAVRSAEAPWNVRIHVRIYVGGNNLRENEVPLTWNKKTWTMKCFFFVSFWKNASGAFQELERYIRSLNLRFHDSYQVPNVLQNSDGLLPVLPSVILLPWNLMSELLLWFWCWLVVLD